MQVFEKVLVCAGTLLHGSACSTTPRATRPTQSHRPASHPLLLLYYFHTTSTLLVVLLPHTSQDVYSSEAVRGEVPADNLEATLARLNMDLPG